MNAPEPAQCAEQDPAPDRTRVEVERLAADTDRMRARLGPGDVPDLRDAITAATARAYR
jgi:hypothetical protein